MQAVLLIDFGSTFTKVTIVDLDSEEIVGTARAGTTIETSIMEGLKAALAQIPEPAGGWNFARKLACSSAAGGLKMIASGLVKELTAEAARRAALGAGARVLQVFSYELTPADLNRIISYKPDILLLAGGTDGGNKEVLLKNAEMLGKLPQSLPVVIAGNKVAAAQAAEILRKRHSPVVVADNVMPELGVLSVESARLAIRDVFLTHIIQAKGLDTAEEFLERIMMPTPAAVLSAAELLAQGHGSEQGMGELMIVDVGGATTDVYSIARGDPSKPSVMLKGLPEPYAKRTVEGDLGMRYSSEALVEAAGRRLSDYLGWAEDQIEFQLSLCKEDPWRIPQSEEEVKFDVAMGRVAVGLAVDRHVGTIEVVYTPFGATYVQHGKDLTPLPVVIGTGGVLLHHPDALGILRGAVFNTEEPTLLKPQNAVFYLDKEYILAAMGLLREVAPLAALRIMKKYIVKL
ncbi:methylaspartate mutase accessory protein GlmL [Desulfosporosinus sp. BICA1-9]|uniref:methylaspartate mutase accessory protein GlmL n=1 Tax=Desulfosporosinus sp. BICA1-9 TaxID=1531958 RepID=UPI00054BC581|nr:methylaspartate mutase accessory protein GlmL [Desulfosporosinus sp. BICA1-9]KJS47844.1 MAG: MutL protein [Peptococcaceae bacterium BRH_c23]KJS90402.1 MAG: MutL protein [Desulfosporosinus sp. BICA1-9]HBW35820.1 MutL protein [Desulfosporosinus sp.]